MRELLGELPRPASAAPTDDLVAAVRREAALGLTAREAFGPRSQLAEQELVRLPGIVDRGCFEQRSHASTVAREARSRIGETPRGEVGKYRAP